MFEKPLLQVDKVSKSYGDIAVSQSVNFSLNRGEIGCLLGPSGCGKTTLLRIIAGFEKIDKGEVLINGGIVSGAVIDVPPDKRSIGMVFQDYALFPHMTVAENVAFGLHGLSSQQKKGRVREMLFMVGLEGVGSKYPYEISGGQQQRIALARALAPQPELLLLDEPFSNLDAVLRDRLTVEVRNILKELGTTALLVTHNQNEAFSVADKIGVLFDGQMQQWADAYSLYHNPSNIEVATFVGEGSLLPGVVEGRGLVRCGLGVLSGADHGFEVGDRVELLIRPEDVVYTEKANLGARILDKSFRGPTILYKLELPCGQRCQALVSSHHDHQIGGRIGIKAEVDHLIAFAAPPEPHSSTT